MACIALNLSSFALFSYIVWLARVTGGLVNPIHIHFIFTVDIFFTFYCLQKHLQCKSGHLYGAFNEHYFVNESMAQLK